MSDKVFLWFYGHLTFLRLIFSPATNSVNYGFLGQMEMKKHIKYRGWFLAALGRYKMKKCPYGLKTVLKNIGLMLCKCVKNISEMVFDGSFVI